MNKLEYLKNIYFPKRIDRLKHKKSKRTLEA